MSDRLRLMTTDKTVWNNSFYLSVFIGVHLWLSFFSAMTKAGPQIGFNLWDPMPHPEDPDRIAREVQAMHDGGFKRVSLIPFVYCDMNTGRTKPNWPGDTYTSMTDAELKAGIIKAKELGMTVNVTPFVIPRNFSPGRHMITFTPATVSGKIFWDDYTECVVNFAKLAKEAKADEFNVGSELVGIDYEPANAEMWKRLIDQSAEAYGNTVGYTTQHWTFDQDATIDMIWSHPKINVVSISAYLTYQPEHGHAGLASLDDCRGDASDSPKFVETVTRNVEDFYQKRLKPVADKVHKPIRIGEFGVPPYDTAATIPWKYDWSKDDKLDVTEAVNTWRGVLAAFSKHKEIRSLDAWIWGWPGGFPDERFYLRPNAVDQPGEGFDESVTRPIVEVIRRAAEAE